MDSSETICALLDSWAERTVAAATLKVPSHLRWMGAEGIAAMLDFKPRYLLEHIANLPDFPEPLRLGGEGHPKWNVAEVQAWALAHRERHSAAKPN